MRETRIMKEGARDDPLYSSDSYQMREKNHHFLDQRYNLFHKSHREWLSTRNLFLNSFIPSIGSSINPFHRVSFVVRQWTTQAHWDFSDLLTCSPYLLSSPSVSSGVVLPGIQQLSWNQKWDSLTPLGNGLNLSHLSGDWIKIFLVGPSIDIILI